MKQSQQIKIRLGKRNSACESQTTKPELGMGKRDRAMIQVHGPEQGRASAAIRGSLVSHMSGFCQSDHAS